jgi:chemotaxis protein CheY-P-specific phosphatase CheC
MRVDMQTLGTFNELAHEGAQAAASSLSELTGTSMSVDVTRADLVPMSDLGDEFDGQQFVGVEIEFDGGMDGSTVLVFERESAETLLESMMPASWEADDSLDQSGVTEAANIMVGGFLGAWADHYGTTIKPGPPNYVAGGWPGVLPEEVPLWNERQTALTFTSQLYGVDERIDFHLYMFPERESFTELVEGAMEDDRLPVSIDKLSVFNEMTKEGTRRAAEKITTMTNIDTEVDVSRLTFVPIDDVEDHAADGQRIGAVSKLKMAPGGFIAILFDAPSAKRVGDALLPMEVDGDGLTDHHRSAIEEIGNIMTSGFIDGWANSMDRKIQHEPPDIVEDSGAATLGSLAQQLEDGQEYAFILDSTVQTSEGELNCDLFALPQEEAFHEVIGDMSLETASNAVDDPDALEPSAYEELE